jgi:hypothetical protein
MKLATTFFDQNSLAGGSYGNSALDPIAGAGISYSCVAFIFSSHWSGFEQSILIYVG